jgi:biopolymer transport protein ExbD
VLRFPSRANEEEQPNLTSLIDVIFILLIFFMISTQFKKAQLPLELPAVEGRASRELDLSLVISIDENRRIYLGETPVDLKDIEEVLTAERSTNPEISLIMDCHRDISIEYVLNVLAEVKNAGIQSIKFRHESIRD